MPSHRSIELHLAPSLLPIFYPLLMAGVEVGVETGCSIKMLLTEQFGISTDYVNSRITTLFLNSKAVDNAATALIHDGVMLALSGAMPGLVGATMRSGGFYAAMRGAMTYREEGAEPGAHSGRIKLKLFNLLLEELGPRVLRRGILLSGERLREFLTAQPETFRPLGCWVDGRALPIERLQQTEFGGAADQQFKLQVQFGD